MRQQGRSARQQRRVATTRAPLALSPLHPAVLRRRHPFRKNVGRQTFLGKKPPRFAAPVALVIRAHKNTLRKPFDFGLAENGFKRRRLTLEHAQFLNRPQRTSIVIGSRKSVVARRATAIKHRARQQALVKSRTAMATRYENDIAAFRRPHRQPEPLFLTIAQPPARAQAQRLQFGRTPNRTKRFSIPNTVYPNEHLSDKDIYSSASTDSEKPARFGTRSRFRPQSR